VIHIYSDLQERNDDMKVQFYRNLAKQIIYSVKN